MNKKLHFISELIPAILARKKTSTWRLWDDKNLTKGDVVDFLETGTEKHFATARLTKVIEKPIGELTEKDKAGHEEFKSDQEIYETFSRYYQHSVGPKTLVKIIWFKLIK